jgi:hypothetical protein
MRALYIANGALYQRHPDGRSEEITSPFAKEVIERDAQSRRHKGWKTAPRDNPTGILSGAALWGQSAQDAAGGIAPARFLYACQGRDSQTLYYVLSVGRSVGLFRRHLDDGREIRLFHRDKTSVLGMTFDAEAGRIILANGNADGTAQLDVYDEEGNLKGSVTGGDCVDAAPCMVAGASATLMYQSCGVARHPESGYVIAMGHSTVNRLNYTTGKLEALLEEPAYDYVSPRMSRESYLYAIRRPVEKPVHEQAGTALKDIVLMPFRLAKAVFGYLNFFSTIYGKEPLKSAGGPRAPELDQDLGKLWLHGRLIELKRIQQDAQFAGRLVPASWELVKLYPGGRTEVLAKHVASFDVADDESILYSDGFELHQLTGGKTTSLGRQNLVEFVCCVK